MKLRLWSIAFLLGSMLTGVAWLTMQPLLLQLLEALRSLSTSESPAAATIARARGLLPFYLGLDLLVSTVICYAVLHLTVGRPLLRAEEEIEQLGRLGLDPPQNSAGGPLLSRLERALKKASRALRDEQETTQRQLRELQEAHGRLTRTQTELIASERLASVGRLAAGVAHEVGNPLGGILGYVSLLRSRSADRPEMKELLERVEAEVRRIDQIVRGLLDLGRPPRGKPGPIELASISTSCVKLAAAGPDFAEVTIDSVIPQGLFAIAEPGPLSQVLINLLLNAAQAMQGRGTLELSARHEGPQVFIEVRDHGPGIPEDVLPRLFEPFFTTKSAGKGTGLGLAVSRHLAAAMGGELSAANAQDGGARFTLRLPAA